jgi:threonine dehydrogenase-like Zn-dependent dehydrogenase
MKALTWQGRRNVVVEDVPDPVLKEDTDAIIRVTSSGVCGSDLHLYEVLGPFIGKGDILGHEPIGIVEEVGSAVKNISPGDRVVVPFNISCGACFMCARGLQSQCETTQVRDHQTGAALFGYTKLYGEVPGAQAEYLRVPQAHYGPIKLPKGPRDDRFVYLSDVLPTAWQAVTYADVPLGGTLVVLGLGPIGDMATRVAQHHGIERIIGIDIVPERLERARAHGVHALDFESEGRDLTEHVRMLTGGRGPDSVIDAVGMEAHGMPSARAMQNMTALLSPRIAARVMERVGVDRLTSLHVAIDIVRRGGTVSITGVYGGMTDPMPMMTLFDKQVQLRMGQANVRRWTDEIMPLLLDDRDPLGVETFATHHLPLIEGPAAYRMFQEKKDGAVKILLRP